MIRFALLIILAYGLTQFEVIAQDLRNVSQDSFQSFLAGFEAVEWPHHFEPPNPFYTAKNKPSIDSLLVEKYLTHEKFYGVEYVEYGHLLYQSEDLHVLSMLIGFDYRESWFVVTFNAKGDPIDAEEVASFFAMKGTMFEEYSMIDDDLQIEVNGTRRHYSDSYRTLVECFKTKYTLQVRATGIIERIGELKETSCE